VRVIALIAYANAQPYCRYSQHSGPNALSGSPRARARAGFQESVVDSHYVGILMCIDVN
jgi:hypothetical protein